MKRYIVISNKDKNVVKMINQTEKGFDLVIISDEFLSKIMNLINTYKDRNDEINIYWQMKFKENNYILYKNCTFSEPMENYKKPIIKKSYFNWGGYDWSPENDDNKPKLCGKKINVKCSGVDFFSESNNYRLGKGQKVPMSKRTFNDAFILNRTMKISQLNLKSEENE